MTRLRHGAAWTAVAAMAASAVSPWSPRGGTPAAMIQSLMPWSALSALPLAVGAAATGRRRLAVASSAVGLVGLAVAAPLVVPRRQSPADPAAAPLTITHANLLYVNRRIGAVPAALARLDADVVTFSELTPAHRRRLHRGPLATTYPHQIELAAPNASGTGLWSRWPLTAHEWSGTRHRTVIADVHAPGGTVRVIVIHTVSPMHGYDAWAEDLERLAELTPTGPAVMTGDFNASWWHPELRRLMRAGGWRDAHQVVGRGLSTSWPTARWNLLFVVHPPFVRLDHALVNDGVRVLGAADFDVPGSDHLGITVTVQRARPAAP